MLIVVILNAIVSSVIMVNITKLRTIMMNAAMLVSLWIMS
jgi:hypothetical protein